MNRKTLHSYSATQLCLLILSHLSHFSVGEDLLTDLKTSVEENSDWIRHDIKKGKFPTITHHKLVEHSESEAGLHVRCETPIDPSLLSPLLSVLNETDLYKTW